MHDDTPLTSIGDEPVEARIVAWVLGEASGFEAAELERLCEERPELLVFRRRMLALHGLLTEAEAAKPDESWKLPPEKRRVLDDIFGTEIPVLKDPQKEQRIRRSGRRALFAIAACLVLTVVVVGMMGFGAGKHAMKGGLALKRSVQEAEFHSYMPAAEPRDSQPAVQQLNQAVRDQEDKVEDRRKMLATLERTKEILGADGTNSDSAAKRGLDAQDASATRRDLENDEALLQAMKTKQIEETIASKRSYASERRSGLSPLVENSSDSLATDKLRNQGEVATRETENHNKELAARVPLKTELPPELIEGTPRAIVLPGMPAKPAPPVTTGPVAVEKPVDSKSDLGRTAANSPAPTVTKTGAEALALSGTNTYNGGSTVSAGTLSNDSAERFVRNRQIDSERATDEWKVSASSVTNSRAAPKTPPAGAVAKDLLAKQDPSRLRDLENHVSLAATDDSTKPAAGPAPAPPAAPVAESPAARADESGRLALGDTIESAPATATPPTLSPARAPRPRAVPPVAAEPPPAEITATGHKEVHGKNATAASKPASGTHGGVGGGIGGSGTLTTDTDGDGTAVTDGLRSGDQELNRNSIDAILNNPNRTAKENESQARNKKLAADKVPVLGDIPVLGRLHGGEAGQNKPADRNGRELGQNAALGITAGTLHLEAAKAAPPKQAETGKHGWSEKSDRSDKSEHDQTRAELLGQASSTWELKVPMDEAGKDQKFNYELHAGYRSEDLHRGLNLGQDLRELDCYTEPDHPLNITPPPTGFTGSINNGSSIAEAKKLPAPRGMIVDRRELPAAAEALQKAIKEQEDKVEDRRKVLATIVRTKGIIYKGTDSFYDQGGVDEDQGAHDALETYQKLQQQKMQLESQINCMLKYDNDQLMNYAGGLDLPENTVKSLYPQYKETKRKLESLKINGLADNHPAMRAANEQIAAMKRQLDEGVVNLRATLKAQLDLADDRLKSVEGMKDSTREDAIKRGLDAQDYVDAKRDFENDQAFLQQLKLKMLKETGAAAANPADALEKMKKNLQESDAPLPAPEKPKLDLTKLIEEVAATEEPYSTFSLNISDASFKVAQAALARGERPDPAGIKEEQFYNAVDYGDPSPTAGEPVAVAIEQAAHPFIPGRNLVRVALKTAAAGRAASQPLRLTLLVDQSGSMVRDDRRAAMDKALTGLSSLLTANDMVTVIGFARTPRLLADAWTGEQAAKLADLINQTANEGGTNLEEAIKLGEQLAERHQLATAQNRIVLFTDGAANLGDADPAHLAAKVKALRQKGIAFDIAGIAADDLNDGLLGELARNGNGRYYVVGKGAGDDGIARQLAGAFRPAAENVKVQVHFNQERVARYKLIGFEKDRLKTEDFRNDAVDAAEMAAEEAGVAIYQVEPILGGSGELGDVSVRFRDTASGQMVERTWNIPHDASAPAIDRAKPSMQLAVLAMLAADKLRDGPLAEAIDFKQLAESRANVKRFYGTTGRAAEVLHMIDGL